MPKVFSSDFYDISCTFITFLLLMLLKKGMENAILSSNFSKHLL